MSFHENRDLFFELGTFILSLIGGVSFDSDLELVQKLPIDIAQRTDRMMKEPAPYVHFRSMIDNAVELKLRIWVCDPENGTSGIQSDIILEA